MEFRFSSIFSDASPPIFDPDQGSTGFPRPSLKADIKLQQRDPRQVWLDLPVTKTIAAPADAEICKQTGQQSLAIVLKEPAAQPVPGRLPVSSRS